MSGDLTPEEMLWAEQKRAEELEGDEPSPYRAANAGCAGPDEDPWEQLEFDEDLVDEGDTPTSDLAEDHVDVDEGGRSGP